MLASAAVFAVLVFVGDGADVAAALAGFSPVTLLAMLLLGAVGFVVRGLRWGALMGVAGYPVSWRDAVYLHLAGQTMGVTPGRVGEVFKPWLAKGLSGMPMSRGVPLVFAERVADLIAVVLLASGGLTAIGGRPWVLALALGVVLAGTAVAGSAWFHRLAIGLVERGRWSRTHGRPAQAIADTLNRTLAWRVLAWSVPASVIAWGLEGVAFALALHEVGIVTLDVFASVSVYSVATIAGAFSFLPGGIGFTEASMAGILAALGAPVGPASAATLVIRLTTLWWGVALGWGEAAERVEVGLLEVEAPEDGAGEPE